MDQSTTQVIALAIQAGAPVLLWGEPGTGKSTLIEAMAKALRRHLEIVIAAIREPADFAGYPVPTNDELLFRPAGWARRAAAASSAIVFLDELSYAPPATQDGCLRVVLERVVGELAMPATVSMVAAANPPDTCGGWDLKPALANRFLHVTWNLDGDVWVRGMLSPDFPKPSIPILPETWRGGYAAQRTVVGSFIKARPGRLLDKPKDQAEQGRAWPSPRSWERGACVMLAACQAAQVSDDVEAKAVSAAVGPGAALEFLSWRRELDLPDPEELLAHPQKFKLPKRGDQQFAVLAAVAAAAVRRLTPERWLAAWKIFELAAKQGPKDVAAAAVHGLCEVGKKKVPDELPIPTEEVKPFLPILKAAGWMA